MTDPSWFEPFSPHQQAKRPQPHRQTPPTADLWPRPGPPGPGQQHAKPCCGPPTSP